MTPLLDISRSAHAILARAGLLMLLTACGCSASKVYSSRTLPNEWRAIAAPNVQTLDLTKLAAATIPSDRIAEGDVLEITIAAGLGRDDIKTFPARVNTDGTVNVLHVGSVPVDGLEITEAEGTITQACIDRQIYRSPLVTVVLKQPKVNQVTVMGAVQTPSILKLRSGASDVLQAIAQAGGLTKEASPIVEVRHPGYRPAAREDSAPFAGNDEAPRHLAGHSSSAKPIGRGDARLASNSTSPDGPVAKSFRIDLASLGKENPSIYELEDGSVVNVIKQDLPALQVLGLVHKPNRYEYPLGKQIRVLDAISLAGGTSNSLADKIYVIRRREGDEPMLVQLSMRRSKRNGNENLLLEPGDTVSVEQTPATVVIDAVRTIGVNLGGALF